MFQQTIDKLAELRLAGFIEALSEQAHSTQYLGLSFEERLACLVDREYLRRKERRLAQTLKEAHLKQRCSIEDIDFEAPRGLHRPKLMELAHCNWIREHHNLIITGPTGAGKSFLACALADRACKLQFRALYMKCSDLLRELLLAKVGATYHKMASRIARMDLLIIDEWLRDPLSQEHAREILDLLDDRFRQASTIFISQIPTSDWHQRILDPTLADALLDRIVHDSLKLEISGDSMRKLTATVHKNEPSLRSD